MKRILVGTDFSPESHLALAHALRIARRLDATLLLAHAGSVIEPTAAALAPESAVLVEYQKIVAEHLVENRHRLAELVAEVKAQGLKAEEHLIDGFADTALRDAAEALDADLVVIGTHGRTGLKRILLGSVAERVVRLCRRHVLVARATGIENPTPGQEGYQRILVPTDFGPLAERALEIALSLLDPHGVIELFHAWHLPLSSTMVPGRAAEAAIEPVRISIEQGARGKAQALLDRFPDAAGRVTVTVFNESPTRAISERAEQGHDLIVMGGHGHRGLSRWILGSVAEATVRHAPCSVLVVHARIEETETEAAG